MAFKNIIWKYEKKTDGTCAVKIYVCINRKVKYYPVKGIYVEEKYWDAKKGIVKSKHPLHQTYNSLIREKRFKVEKHFLEGGSFEDFNPQQNIKGFELTQLFDKHLEKAEKGEIKQSEGTIVNYRSTLSKLKKYIEYTGQELYVNDINAAFQESFIAFMRDHNVSLSTIGLHFTRIKFIIGQEANHNNTYFQKLPSSRKHRSSKTQIYLTPEEINSIENIELNTTLDTHRNRFLICYYFLLRISDSYSISKSSIINSDGAEYLFIRYKTTNNEQIIPINTKAKAILEKHSYKFKKTSIKTANEAVKKIGALAGINTSIDSNDGVVQKYQLINTHTARRSAATNLRLQGASLKTIADLGGWSDMSTLESYLKASELDSAKMVRDFDHFK